MGSLVAALASYLDAKAHQGKWLLRIEDLDPPRESQAAKTLIPEQLKAHHLLWDDPIQYQSQHGSEYENALQALKLKQRLFPCSCSRKQLGGALHQGICNHKSKTSESSQTAQRLLVPDEIWSFNDRIYGHHQQNLKQEVGDQILKRKDGFYAYQLAVVVDDQNSQITHVVRGADLLDNTERQLYLQDCLGYQQPSYLHLPLATNETGQKLSKQNQAKALDLSTPAANLFQCLTFLNQQPPESLKQTSCPALLIWATEHWNPAAITPSHEGIV